MRATRLVPPLLLRTLLVGLPAATLCLPPTRPGPRAAPAPAPVHGAAPAPAPGLVPGLAPPSGSTSLTDTFVSRVEALAAMQTLNADILASRSATAALERWCDLHRFATPATVRAERVAYAPDVPASIAVREHLQVGPKEPIRYRRVRLSCGGHLLSDADNWYVPARLTPEMNRALDTTDTPFGKAVAELGFTRDTLAATVVWSALPSDWEGRPHPVDRPGRPLYVPPVLFEHEAVLSDRSHRPFSEVHEHYLRDALPFAAPPAAPAADQP